METDTEGRLWVLDNGSGHCPSKIWIFNLLKNDNTELVHQFPDAVVSHSFSNRYLRDIVIDKTPDDYLAYITDSLSEHIIVYSQKNNLSWPVKTPGYKFSSISLSPEEPKQLYLRISLSKVLCSIPVVAFAQNGNAPAKTLNLIVTWKESAYRMLIDTNRTMYVAFYNKDYIVAREINKPFNERRIYEIADLSNTWPFTFALDSSGNLWITQLKINWWSRRYSLLKIAVGSKPYIFGSRQTPETSSSVTPMTSTSLTANKSTHAPQSNVSSAKDTSHEVRDCNNDAKYQSLLVLNTVLSCWNVFSLFSIASQILWFRRMKKMQDCIAKTKKESEQMCSNPPIYNRIEPDTSEPIYEEVAAVPSTSTSAQRTVAEVYT
ncbi:uncharacterized protein LOC135936504 [Cloeon dipterum]|uniref:uncharacterized protein LOC135936504 n=1 Tax=Cloeon dipterum TaxID=197152 RepID=UPI0032205810